MKTRVHISLPVSNLETSKAFYAALFGTAPSKVKPDYANWRLEAPALHLALVHAPQAVQDPNNVRHFGIELFDDSELGDWRERVKQAGVAVRIEEEIVCCYAKADKFWAQDPDGNEWEFWVRHEEAESMHETPAAEGQCCAPSADAKPAKQSACCTPAQKAEAQAAKTGCC